MRITRATSADGRVFDRVPGGYRVTAKAAPAAEPVSPSLARILRPQAAYRWLLPQIASITPQYIEMVLRGALAGNHVQQWELFDLMMDSWPELAACCQELVDGVSCLKLIFEPFCEEDEDPTPGAVILDAPRITHASFCSRNCCCARSSTRDCTAVFVLRK